MFMGNPGRRGAFGWLLAAWVVLIASGAAGLQVYKTTAGSPGHPPDQVPSTAVDRQSDGPRLTLFVHPRCPCSRASLHEFQEIVARAPAGVRAEVVFVRPPGVTEGWERGNLWDEANALRGVRVTVDCGAAEAERFGVSTSGHTLLYDADGKLAFSGGITRARGHDGENSGSRGVLGRLRGEPDGADRFPVFGCPLIGTGTSSAGGNSSCRR
jgi:hypothetical protein